MVLKREIKYRYVTCGHRKVTCQHPDIVITGNNIFIDGLILLLLRLLALWCTWLPFSMQRAFGLNFAFNGRGPVYVVFKEFTLMWQVFWRNNYYVRFIYFFKEKYVLSFHYCNVFCINYLISPREVQLYMQRTTLVLGDSYTGIRREIFFRKKSLPNL